MLKRNSLRLSQRSSASNENGIALLSVVVVLSTLLIIGILFAFTVDLDLKASRYYRDAGQAEQMALEGLYRANAEILYDMWGVNEPKAFPLTDTSAVMSDSAYSRAGGSKILSAKSKFRQSVATIGGDKAWNDYRWMMNYDDDKGTGVHSGAAGHDEFLPDHCDNSDVWELGLHINRGDIFFEDQKPRSFGNDEKLTGLPYSNSDQRSTYWDGKRTQPWDTQWDYIDSRINGDSFFKIFRTELVWNDGGDFRSNYAGVQDRKMSSPGEPMNYLTQWVDMKTHIGNAGLTELGYTPQYGPDTRGGAFNVNQVNNNYPFEGYYAQTAPGEPYTAFHYKDSKWIYLYDENGRKRGRYAALVWGDGGTPSANYMYFSSEDQSGLRQMAEYFDALDNSFDPRGDQSGANVMQTFTAGNGEALGNAINFHVVAHGPITSRAEMNIIMRKSPDTDAVFDKTDPVELKKDTDLISALVTVHGYENLMGPHWEKDRLVIDGLGYNHASDMGRKKIPGSALQSETSYIRASGGGLDTRKQMWHLLENLKFYWGPDKNREGGYTQYSTKLPAYDPGKVAGDPNAAFAMKTLGTYASEEASVTKAKVFSWLTAAQFYARNDFLKSTGADLGWAGDVSSSTSPNLAPRDPVRNTLTRTQDFSWGWVAQINEVGTISGAEIGVGLPAALVATPPAKLLPADDPTGERFKTMKGALSYNYALGWKALEDSQDYHFIEFVDVWDMGYTFTKFSFRGERDGYGDNHYWHRSAGDYSHSKGVEMELYVDGTEVLSNPRTRIVSIHGDLDNEGGIDGYYRRNGADTNSGDYVRSDFNYNFVDAWYLDQKRPNGDYGSGLAGMWASDLPMVRPTDVEVAAGKTARDVCWGNLPSPDNIANPPFVSSINKFFYDRNDGGKGKHRYEGWKESWGRYLPVNYLLVMWPSNAGVPDGTKIEFVIGNRNDRIADIAFLPGNLSAGYSCYDFLANQHPAMWAHTNNVIYNDPTQLTNMSQVFATPAWRTIMPAAATPSWIELQNFNQSAEAWWHGLNSNATTTYTPGAESLPNGVLVGNASKVMDPNGESRAGLSSSSGDQSLWNSSSLAVVGKQEIHLVYGGRSSSLNHWGQAMNLPTGFFPRTFATGRGGMRQDVFMRTWRDLMRVAPLGQYFSLGYFGGSYLRYDIKSHLEMVIYDSYDNNMDGHTDNLVAAPLWSGAYDVSGGEPDAGHFVGDRAVVGRVFLNQITHPAAIWYTGVSNGKYRNQTTVAGRKPFKGYTSWVDIITRGSYYTQGDDNPYNSINFWYDNQFADASTDNTSNGRMIESIGSDVGHTARLMTTGTSPVFTVYVTAQSLDPTENPLAEIKIRSTMERTWDGKINLLDFRWVPGEVRPGN